MKQPSVLSQSPEDDAFHAAIGRLTVYWAMIESAIDGLVIDLFHNLGNPRGEKEMPIALARKLRYLRMSKHAVKFPLFDLAQFEKLLADVEVAAVRRHDIIHGVMVEYAHEEGEAVFLRRMQGRTGKPPKRIELSTEAIREDWAKAMYYAIRLSSHSVLVHDEIERLRQPHDGPTL
jgi:hypothetical protein